MGSSGRLITSADIADLAIVNADVATGAGIVASKLAAGSTANRVVATVDGTTMAMQTIATAMLATDSVTTRVADAQGTTTTTTTGSSPAAAFADPSVTINLASAGDILVWASLGMSDNSGGSLVSLYVQLDGGSLLEVSHVAGAAGVRVLIFAFHLYAGLSAGNHTITLGRSANANTITYYPQTRRILALGIYR